MWHAKADVGFVKRWTVEVLHMDSVKGTAVAHTHETIITAHTIKRLKRYIGFQRVFSKKKVGTFSVHEAMEKKF